MHSSAAWGEARRAAALNEGGIPGWRLPVRGPVSWQPRHGSLPGKGLGCWACRGIARRRATRPAAPKATKKRSGPRRALPFVRHTPKSSWNFTACHTDSNSVASEIPPPNRVLASFGAGSISKHQSFPRKRESTPQTSANALSRDRIPAFAGMTGVPKSAHAALLSSRLGCVSFWKVARGDPLGGPRQGAAHWLGKSRAHLVG